LLAKASVINEDKAILSACHIHPEQMNTSEADFVQALLLICAFFWQTWAMPYYFLTIKGNVSSTRACSIQLQ